MPIINSVITKTVEQVDGRTDVTESHIDQNGIEYQVNYLAAVGLDLNAVLMERAALIGADIDAKAAVTAAAQAYELPLSTTQFLGLLTRPERIAIRKAAVSDDALADYLDYLAKTRGIYRKAPLGQTTINGLNYLESVGLLAAGRAAEILSA